MTQADGRRKQFHAIQITSIDEALRIKYNQRVEAWLCEDRHFREMKCDRRCLQYFRYTASGQHTLMGLPIFVRS